MFIATFSCKTVEEQVIEKPTVFSGVYPHLAYYNSEQTECGTGAVVPWADRLWVISYGAGNAFGSSDKLYEITPDLRQIVRTESIGGTHANRMIHKESNQLFMGLYAIDANREVKVIPYDEMPGRLTGFARHLTDPENFLYCASMEEGFYEIDVNSLETTMLYEDGFVRHAKGIDSTVIANPLLPGAHGKGAYSGQGVMVYSLNGEEGAEALERFDVKSGSLSEWDGENWTMVRRNQFVEVTGPGGIYGNNNPETDPIWATGWDHKSIILGVRHHETGWDFYRLPKASHSYDGAHGWNTEWPRIRNVGTNENPDYLMTMHGMFWRFPGTFNKNNSAGIRPRSAYLKVIGDFTRWNDQLVFGCDDAAHREFLNERSVKGDIEGTGQSNSNLWFTSLDQPDQLGPGTAAGSVWLNEEVNSGIASEPFLFNGWDQRSVWLHNHGNVPITLTFEVDLKGNGQWTLLREENLLASSTKRIVFSDQEKGEWVRLTSNINANITAQFSYTQIDSRSIVSDPIFEGITKLGESEGTSGLLYGLGEDRRVLGISARESGGASGYYELGADMKLRSKEDPETRQFIDRRFAIPKNVVSVEESSILVVDDEDRRWRLPLGNKQFDRVTNSGISRICREVVTERDLLNLHGTFYELPAENADGFAKIRPVASHDYQIHDYASYRGLLVMTGINPEAGVNNSHIIVSGDKKAAVWVGAIDDLWKMGKPVGRGGPWLDSQVQAKEESDPYLIGFYHKKKLTLKHDLEADVTFTVEVEPVGHGPWMKYQTFTVSAGQSLVHQFPEDFQARWIKFKVNKDCTATALVGL